VPVLCPECRILRYRDAALCKIFCSFMTKIVFWSLTICFENYRPPQDLMGCL
jgi:hypothetical protein